MTTRSSSRLMAPIAALLLVCGGALQPVAAQETAPPEELTDERVTELARGYVELLWAGEHERLWQHMAPEAQERIGTFERFRSGNENVMNKLGTEVAVIEERVEPARVGMIAHRLYYRTSHYTGGGGASVRLTIGLVNDGSIGGMSVRPVQQ